MKHEILELGIKVAFNFGEPLPWELKTIKPMAEGKGGGGEYATFKEFHNAIIIQLGLAHAVGSRHAHEFLQMVLADYAGNDPEKATGRYEGGMVTYCESCGAKKVPTCPKCNPPEGYFF